MAPRTTPGYVVLFGSGETAPNGRRVYQWLFERLDADPNIAVLETPAGFQPNSELVAREVADYIAVHLPSFRPKLHLVAARGRGTSFSPDDPGVVAPLLDANVIFAGPGSPTYAVRQFHDSLAWHTVLARHRLGAAVVLASASTLAAGAYTVPVYEIYKAGDDLHWIPGLDLLRPFGLELVFVPHWNNTDGGQDLDTSRCYVGQQRFGAMLDMLDPRPIVVGLHEHSALAFDPATGLCHVLGASGVTIQVGDEATVHDAGESFAASELGPFRMPGPSAGIPPDVWQAVSDHAAAMHVESLPESQPDDDVIDLVAARESARRERDWATADTLRGTIERHGWAVRDTADGPELTPIGRD